MTPKHSISVRQFATNDLDQVAQLFREVMLASFPDPSHELYTHWCLRTERRLCTDIADIPGAYIAPGGNFWVAIVPDRSGSECIAGIVGLERKSEAEGKVRSMYVRADHHRQGIGRALMTRLLDWTKTRGYRRVFLSTIADNTPSRRFYESLGFEHCAHSPPIAIFDGRLEIAEYSKAL